MTLKGKVVPAYAMKVYRGIGATHS